MNLLRISGAVLFWLCGSIAMAQVSKPLSTEDSLIMSTIDTAALYDSVLAELQMMHLLNKPRKKSFTDISLVAGNGNYLRQSDMSGKGNQGHIVYTLGAGYYHRSGLSLAGGASATNDGGRFGIYQGFISPSYTFYRKDWAAGISAFRYFNKDSVGFYLSPLVNEVYVHVTIKKWWLQPKLAVDYAWGEYNELEWLQYIDTMRYRRFAPIVRYLSRQPSMASVSDLSLLLSVRHPFTWGKPLSRKYWLFIPSATLLAGTSTYGTNTPFQSLSGPRLSNLTTVQTFRTLYENATAPPDPEFKLQNLNLNVSATWYAGAFYLQGQFIAAYMLPRAYSGWQVYANVGIGASF